MGLRRNAQIVASVFERGVFSDTRKAGFVKLLLQLGRQTTFSLKEQSLEVLCLIVFVKAMVPGLEIGD